MKKTKAIAIGLAIVLSGCATSTPSVKGAWKPVNRFASTTEAIPLQQAYLYYPSPMDGTLKKMLTRWAQDSKMTLHYEYSYDFTLHEPVTSIRTASIEQAVTSLSQIYAQQNISVTTKQNTIFVNALNSTL